MRLVQHTEHGAGLEACQLTIQRGAGYGRRQEGKFILRRSRTGQQRTVGEGGLHGFQRAFHPDIPDALQIGGGDGHIVAALGPYHALLGVLVAGGVDHVGHHGGGGGQLAGAPAVEHHVADGVAAHGDGVEYILHTGQRILHVHQMGGHKGAHLTIGAADGPTSILVSQVLGSNYVGAIAVAAYSYMALVPIVQPFAIRLVTTKKERCIRMAYKADTVTKPMRIAFPIIVTLIVGMIAPMSVSLVGFLMFGNLLRECGVLGNLSDTAQNALANLITLVLGITISFSMRAEAFVQLDTLLIMVIGLVAFVFDTIGGVLFAKLMNLFRKEKLNPMIGAAGISAFPMSSRVVQKMAQEESPGNIIIMHAAGANVSGQIASVVAGGLVMSIVASYL